MSEPQSPRVYPPRERIVPDAAPRDFAAELNPEQAKAAKLVERFDSYRAREDEEPRDEDENDHEDDCRHEGAQRIDDQAPPPAGGPGAGWRAGRPCGARS